MFRVTPEGVGTVLYKFCSQPNCSDGSLPLAGLIEHDGALYGTTKNGGTNNNGVVFKLARNDRFWAETALYRFCPQAPCVDGANPYAGVIAIEGTLFGTTAGGGTSNFGTVFKVTLQ